MTPEPAAGAGSGFVFVVWCSQSCYCFLGVCRLLGGYAKARWISSSSRNQDERCRRPRLRLPPAAPLLPRRRPVAGTSARSCSRPPRPSSSRSEPYWRTHVGVSCTQTPAPSASAWGVSLPNTRWPSASCLGSETAPSPSSARRKRSQERRRSTASTCSAPPAGAKSLGPGGGAGLQAAESRRAGLSAEEVLRDRDLPHPPPPGNGNARPRSRVPLHTLLLRGLRAQRAPGAAPVHGRYALGIRGPGRPRGTFTQREGQGELQALRGRLLRPLFPRPPGRTRHPLPQRGEHQTRRAHLHPAHQADRTASAGLRAA